jgi:tRNA G18 (ribose-2'-O)-methylase SpoU
MNNTTIGVPPHPKPWPKDSKYDHELLENGDKRNVLDKYHYWSVEAIKNDLDKNRFDLHIAIENWQHDINIGTIVRAANAFNVNTVHIIGKKHWNRRGAMVTDRYLNIIHHQTVDEFVESIDKLNYEIVAIDVVEGAKPLFSFKFPKKCVLVFGGEGPGLSEEMKRVAKEIVMIEQFGSTRSVNVGVAAGIAMYSWLQQHEL